MNEVYNSHPHMAKFVLCCNGTFDSYFKTTDTGKRGFRHYVIVDKWTDSEENIWYKMHELAGIFIEKKPEFYPLNKFTNSGKVWEYISLSASRKFPVELDKNNFHYHIYYRAIFHIFTLNNS